MGKYDKLYYSIGETAKYFGEEISAIRYWEKQFNVLKPKKNKRGVRFFTAKDMEHIEQIHYLLRVKKMTIEGAKKELALSGETVAEKVTVLRKLKEVRDVLEKLKNKL